MKTLAIETSCDDTCIAIIQENEGGFVVLEKLTYSQIEIHKAHGGVVPELAARSHVDKIIILVGELQYTKEGKEISSSIDFISVTSHPGLPGALVVGISAAYTLGALWEKPVVEVNHIMGHVFSPLIGRSREMLNFPYVCLTVSGGHNDIYVVSEIGDRNIAKNLVNNEVFTKRNHIVLGDSVQVGEYEVKKVAQTIDDAAGEAFDKVSRMLGGPYPGGQRISEIANESPSSTISFSKPIVQEGVFSFSGLKSTVYNYLRKQGKDSLDKELIADVAYSFQKAVVSQLIDKLYVHCKEYKPKTIGIVGGVSANKFLRDSAIDLFEEEVLFPVDICYSTDNAAMIGVAGILEYATKKRIKG